MTLNQIAQQAMKYLDSVGVAADCSMQKDKLFVITDDYLIILREGQSDPVEILRKHYPQKSPA